VIFHSLDFVIFFLVVLGIYWMLKRKFQNILLLLASYFFYGYIHHWFLILIAISTVNDYFCGLAMAAYPHKKKVFLSLSLAVNLGLLGVFKYFGFFVENIRWLLNMAGLTALDSVNLGIVVPVGISFYTFQTLSYTIDIYRGNLTPRKNFIDFALFVSFFPQLVAGPIERASRLLPQLEKERTFKLDTFMEGFQLATWGFFKKLVIADNVGFIVDKIFALTDPGFYLVWTGAFAFGIQIYADFSAYTDIARGTAKILGITITPNFNHPYLAKSPMEFWQRWHISFSTWLRDYLFLPIAYAVSGRIKSPACLGIKAETWAYSVGILGTMFLCGLWHGASWNFVSWGVYYGVLILLYRAVGKKMTRLLRKARRSKGKKKAHRVRWTIPLRVFWMFLLTHLGWLIFREQNFSQLIRYFSLSPFVSSGIDDKIALYLFSLSALYSLPLWFHAIYAHLREKSLTLPPGKSRLPAWPRWTRYAAALLCYLLIFFLHSPETTDFIYFQF
jgi:alginate O-acetyltransferase complex protein AlgI